MTEGRNALTWGMFEPDPNNALNARPPTQADAYSYNAPVLRDAWAAARDPQTWQDAAQQYSQALLAGSAAPGAKGMKLGPDALQVLREMSPGFRAYHGSPHDLTRIEPQPGSGGNYGTAAYFHEGAADAERYRAGGHVYEANLHLKKPFHMDQPISVEDSARILRAAGQDRVADITEKSGEGWRNGSELWHWGLGQGVSQETKAAALKEAGYDAVIGDPGQEIAGKSTRSKEIAVFDANTIAILRKYGIAGLIAGGGAAAAGKDQPQ